MTFKRKPCPDMIRAEHVFGMTGDPADQPCGETAALTQEMVCQGDWITRPAELLMETDGAIYLCCSALACTPRQKRLVREITNARSLHTGMFDDVSEEKIDPETSEIFTIKEPPFEPTAIMQSSPGSAQWQIKITPHLRTEEEFDLYERWHEAMANERYTQAVGDRVRVCRTVDSINIKTDPKKNGYRSHLTHWSGIGRSLEKWIDLSAVDPVAIGGLGSKYSAEILGPNHIDDEVYDFLRDTGRIGNTNRDRNALFDAGWLNRKGWGWVLCPNYQNHTEYIANGTQALAAYKPCGFDDSYRAKFKCHHAGCQGVVNI